MNEPGTDDRDTDNPAPTPILSYSPVPGPLKTVTVGRYANEMEAQLRAAELNGEGIPSQILNSHTNALGPYGGLADVLLRVREQDVERAEKLLALANRDDLEPLEDAGSAAPLDEEGKPLALATVAGFENVRLLREAQVTLASARINAFLPAMAPRGDGPAGTGRRFILRVAEEAVERAREVLGEASADADEEEGRCPACGSWRVYPLRGAWRQLAAIFGFSPKRDEAYQCLACRFRGSRAVFRQWLTDGSSHDKKG